MNASLILSESVGAGIMRLTLNRPDKLNAIDNPRAERQLFNVCMDRPVDYGEVAAQAGARGAGGVARSAEGASC